MRFLNTALSVTTLGLMSSVAYAANSFIWDAGGSSSVWASAPNWNIGGGDYPGRDNTGDDATIDIASFANPVTLSASLQSLATVTIDAEANSATVELELQTGASLTTTGTVLVKSEQTGADTAAIDYTAGTFAPAALTFDGGSTASALGYFDLDVSVGSGTGALSISAGLADFDIVRSKTLTVGVFTFDSNADFGLAASTGASGVGAISCTSYVQNGGTIVSVGANAQIATN